jgi:membrane-associated protease RseP (regulator of RpoE activity)
VGIGVTIQLQEDESGFLVTKVNEGGPADQAGMLPGDLFVAVDGTDVRGWDVNEASALVKGEANTTVDITVLREGEEITLTLSQAGFDADWNPVILPVSGAVITVNGVPTEVKTDGEGKATVTLTESGQVLISATMEGITAVPPVCKAAVKSSVAAGDGSLLWLAALAILAMAGVCRFGFVRKKLDN